MIHLRGRVKFPTGGDEADASQPASRTGTIRCKSGADSIVWMGEGSQECTLSCDTRSGFICYHSAFQNIEHDIQRGLAMSSNE